MIPLFSLHSVRQSILPTEKNPPDISRNVSAPVVVSVGVNSDSDLALFKLSLVPKIHSCPSGPTSMCAKLL